MIIKGFDNNQLKGPKCLSKCKLHVKRHIEIIELRRFEFIFDENKFKV